MEIRSGGAGPKAAAGAAAGKKYVHMLNATLCATGRAICCLLETYQTDDGVKVPEVLVPFMGGMTFLPFVRDSRVITGGPKEPAAAKGLAGAAGGKVRAAKTSGVCLRACLPACLRA